MVYSCRWWFLLEESLWIRVVFPIQLCSLFLRIYSVAERTCQKLTWNIKTRIILWHHGPEFSGLIHTWELHSEIPGVCLCVYLSVSWQVLAILYSCCSSTQPSYYVLSIPISCTKTLFFPLHPFLSLSLSIIDQFDRILFLLWKVLFYLYYLTLSRYLLSLLSFAKIFWYISSCIVTLIYCSVVSFQCIVMYFSFLVTFGHCRSFLVCLIFLSFLVSLIFYPGFVFLFGFPWGHQFYLWLVLLPHELARLFQWRCPSGYLLII